MKLLVCGGRDYRNEANVWAALDKVHSKRVISVIIEGGCRTDDKETNFMYGADYFAHTWALDRGVTCITEPAKWKAKGKAAGPIRNGEMLRKWGPDGVVAFPGGRGTADMVGKARAAGVKVWEIAG
jgi:hypothetical protein